MKKLWLVVILSVAMAVPGLTPAQTTGRAEVLLEAAKKKELVSGDLDAAIKQYRDIVAKYPANRAVAAEALLRMGRCYEKMGAAQTQEARKAYERIIREYADQKETAAEAQKYLAATPAQGAGAMSSRQVWTLPPSVTLDGTVSHDG